MFFLHCFMLLFLRASSHGWICSVVPTKIPSQIFLSLNNFARIKFYYRKNVPEFMQHADDGLCKLSYQERTSVRKECCQKKLLRWRTFAVIVIFFPQWQDKHMNEITKQWNEMAHTIHYLNLCAMLIALLESWRKDKLKILMLLSCTCKKKLLWFTSLWSSDWEKAPFNSCQSLFPEKVPFNSSQSFFPENQMLILLTDCHTFFYCYCWEFCNASRLSHSCWFSLFSSPVSLTVYWYGVSPVFKGKTVWHYCSLEATKTWFHGKKMPRKFCSFFICK